MTMASPEDKAGQAFESGDKSTTPNAHHTRTYQACIPCRRRKVRCDLGPVDNPHEPPCVRCRREAKECFFSATRRKKRAADSGAGPEDVEPDDYEVRGGRKRLKEGTNGPGSDFGSYDAAVGAGPGASQSPAPFLAQPLTPGGSHGRRQPLRRPDIPLNGFGDSENEEQVNNHTAAMLQTAELHHGHDALNVLLAAAQQHPHSISDTKQSVTFEPYATSTVSPATVQHPSPEMRQKIPRHQSSLSIDPSIMPTEDDNAAALRAWSRFRFVRSGWFSAQEGKNYIEYFYTYLSPLTPIALPDYRHPSRHVALLENEPLLAVTMLMISSRYTMLNESVGRSYALHQRLWDYTQRMIDRLLWGRELPGMNALPGDAGCDVNPLSRKGLLTLGTVESLMLLTEWHSRHVHFPADEDDTELMAPEDGNSAANFTTARERSNRDWLEPCYRSDRMVWKLLNMAMTVALEIGVFDNDSSRHAKVMSKDQAALYAQRRMHVKSLLLVYITQTSGRLGIAAMLPEGYADPSLSELYAPKTRDLFFRDIRDVVVHYWLQLAHLVKMGNLQLYANRQYTREIIRSGKYKALLQTINPLLTKWRQEVDGYRTDIPPQMYHIMMVEYEHSRVCVNQLALQAVLERCINNNTTEGEAGRVLPPGRLDQWYADDRESVGHVIDACRNVLKIVVDGLAPGGFLKHAPVRTSFRMISVSMVLLKTFAFGANTKDMNASLSLMHRTVTALRENVVDDVHIANGFARKIEFLVDRIPKALKRFPGSGHGNSRGASASRGVSRSPAPQSLYVSQRPDNGQAREASSSEHQWPFSGIGTVNNVQGNGQDGSSHPLDGYDFNDNGDTFMLMPPPTNMGHNSMSGAGDYGSYGGGYSSNGFGFSQDGFGDQGWVALPLDNIFGGQNVQQTGFGPTIDGDDMLDVLLRGSVNV